MVTTENPGDNGDILLTVIEGAIAMLTRRTQDETHGYCHQVASDGLGCFCTHPSSTVSLLHRGEREAEGGLI